MGLEAKVKKLEKAVRGSKESFELADGSRYHFDADEVYPIIFTHFMNSLRADYHRNPRPEPPELVRAMAKAKNRRRAYRQVMRGLSFLAYEEESLIEEGSLVPKRLTTQGPVEC